VGKKWEGVTPPIESGARSGTRVHGSGWSQALRGRTQSVQHVPQNRSGPASRQRRWASERGPAQTIDREQEQTRHFVRFFICPPKHSKTRWRELRVWVSSPEGRRSCQTYAPWAKKEMKHYSGGHTLSNHSQEAAPKAASPMGLPLRPFPRIGWVETRMSNIRSGAACHSKGRGQTMTFKRIRPRAVQTPQGWMPRPFHTLKGLANRRSPMTVYETVVRPAAGTGAARNIHKPEPLRIHEKESLPTHRDSFGLTLKFLGPIRRKPFLIWPKLR